MYFIRNGWEGSKVSEQPVGSYVLLFLRDKGEGGMWRMVYQMGDFMGDEWANWLARRHST
jgi:hypothetical protein